MGSRAKSTAKPSAAITRAVVGIIPGKPGKSVRRIGKSKIQLAIESVQKNQQIATAVKANRGVRTATGLYGNAGSFREDSDL